MTNGRIFVNRDITGSLTCLKEDYGRIQLQLKPGRIANESDLDLMSSFLNQCAVQDVDGLILERTRLTDRNIPVLLCYPGKSRRLPAIFFQHGFGAQKETDLHYGIQLAKEGYFVILPDARRHGQRNPADFDQIYEDFFPRFLKIIRETSEDIIAILDLLAGDERVDVTQAGITGVSMGGFICFLAAIMDQRFKVAAPIIGSPDWHSPVGPPQVRTPFMLDAELERFIADWEPLSHGELFFPKALLIQNGLDDINVSFHGSHELHQRLQNLYAETPEKLKLLEYPGVGHIVTDEMIRETVEWFKLFLPLE